MLPILLILTSLAVLPGPRKTDRLQDGLVGPVNSVVETYSQSECQALGPGGYAGSLRVTSYDREGNKASEAFDLYSCDSPRIYYSQAPDGTVVTYEETGRCRNSLPIRVPVYKLVREYDLAGNTLREVSYLNHSMVWRSDYVYDGKSRLVKKTILNAAEPYNFNHQFIVPRPSTFQPFIIGEIYKYGAGAFPQKVTFLRDGKATWSYSYQYEYDSRGNWVKRVELGRPHMSGTPGSKTVTCHTLTYY